MINNSHSKINNYIEKGHLEVILISTNLGSLTWEKSEWERTNVFYLFLTYNILVRYFPTVFSNHEKKCWSLAQIPKWTIEI